MRVLAERACILYPVNPVYKREDATLRQKADHKVCEPDVASPLTFLRFQACELLQLFGSWTDNRRSYVLESRTMDLVVSVH